MTYPRRGDIWLVEFDPARGHEILWSAPVELFCEISMNVRDHSPYLHTFYFGYSNGWLGYLATRKASDEGGYETQTCPFTEHVEDDLTNVATAYLQGHGR